VGLGEESVDDVDDVDDVDNVNDSDGVEDDLLVIVK